jgi:hypothetical protein
MIKGTLRRFSFWAGRRSRRNSLNFENCQSLFLTGFLTPGSDQIGRSTAKELLTSNQLNARQRSELGQQFHYGPVSVCLDVATGVEFIISQIASFAVRLASYKHHRKTPSLEVCSPVIPDFVRMRAKESGCVGE